MISNDAHIYQDDEIVQFIKDVEQAFPDIHQYDHLPFEAKINFGLLLWEKVPSELLAEALVECPEFDINIRSVNSDFKAFQGWMQGVLLYLGDCYAEMVDSFIEKIKLNKDVN